MKKKRINVKQCDIDSGERGTFHSCPIALAVRRAWKSQSRPVLVRHEAIMVGDPEDSAPFWIGTVSPTLSRFIARFDKGKPVKPFTEVIEFR